MKPDPNDGNILLPIASRVNAISYNGSEFLYPYNSFGNGSNRIIESLRYIFDLFLNSNMATYIKVNDIDNDIDTIESSLNNFENQHMHGYEKYLIFNGNISIAPKTVNFAKKTYDLLGSILIFDYEKRNFIDNDIITTGSHAVCGIILNEKEIIIDSNYLKVRKVSYEWSDCTKNTYGSAYGEVTFYNLCSCVYIERRFSSIDPRQIVYDKRYDDVMQHLFN